MGAMVTLAWARHAECGVHPDRRTGKPHSVISTGTV